MSINDFHIPYAVPTVLLAIALLLKAQTLLRAWRDPDVRATAVFLGLATAVFVSVTPVNIHRINVASGVPNLAAPWSYSLLTAFCATCLIMIMRWREAPSEQRQLRMRRVYIIYSAIIAALWATFLLADAPVERIYDLDTYYATTPWMREHILLYLVAHMVSAVVAAYMIGKWFSEVENRWLRAGLVCLQAGYASGLLFDVAKMAAIGARWSGTNWDFLSTKVAPPFALLDAVLVAVGFIIPQAGPALRRWMRDRSDYRQLNALTRTLRAIEPSAARARVGRWAPLDLRLLQRQQGIHDALLRLAPYFDHSLYRETYEAAKTRSSETKARGLAGATALRAAISAYHQGTPHDRGDRPAQIGTDVTDYLDSISAALRRRPLRASGISLRSATTESTSTHA
ncbi:MAB_1171c family putative transporter [Streptomyces sp. NPDC052415]|uniref:MAB_1171c family putative transporter n=1 Tax=Streptomyces sp. NPDC052415 TaxID=3365690 RepID=UPI0037D41F86